MSLLLENNPNVDPICSNIYPGEVCITIDGNPDVSFLHRCRYTGIVHFKNRGVLVHRASCVCASFLSVIRVPGHQITESRKLTVHAILNPRRKLVYK